jgi:DNA-binding MarR family transcriptional regulator
MAKGPSTAVISAWAQLLRSGHAVLSAVEGDLKAAGFPPLSWYDVLLELSFDSEGSLRQHDLEPRLLLRQYAVSRILDRLVKAGYVKRKTLSKDRRGRAVTITAAGCGLLRDMWPSYAAAIERHVGTNLSAGEAEELARLLTKLTAPQ